MRLLGVLVLCVIRSGSNFGFRVRLPFATNLNNFIYEMIDNPDSDRFCDKDKAPPPSNRGGRTTKVVPDGVDHNYIINGVEAFTIFSDNNLVRQLQGYSDAFKLQILSYLRVMQDMLIIRGHEGFDGRLRLRYFIHFTYAIITKQRIDRRRRRRHGGWLNTSGVIIFN